MLRKLRCSDQAGESPAGGLPWFPALLAAPSPQVLHHTADPRPSTCDNQLLLAHVDWLWEE